MGSNAPGVAVGAFLAVNKHNMASPQVENGYTRIANELYEQLYKLKVNRDSLRIILFIIRKTYGWGKKRDKIALSQFSNELNIDRTGVCRTLNKLETMKIIIRIQDDNGNEYEINKNYEEWNVVAKQPLAKQPLELVAKQSIGVVAKQPHTKETTKERESDASVVPSKKTYKEFRDLRRIESGREPMDPRPMTQSQKRALAELAKIEPDIILYRSLALNEGFDYLELPEEANGKTRRQMLSARSRFGEDTPNFYRWIFTTSNSWPKKVNYHPESCITSIMFDAYKNRENKGNNSILKSWGV